MLGFFSRTLESARAQLMVNPPKLSDEMLQKLLSEAHFPLSSHLMALQDDDSKSAHSEWLSLSLVCSDDAR